MRTLEYSPTSDRQTSTARGIAVFAPAVCALVTILLCKLFGVRDWLATVVFFLVFPIAEAITLSVLIVWRKRISLLSIVFGWIVVSIGAILILVVIGVRLGLIFVEFQP